MHINLNQLLNKNAPRPARFARPGGVHNKKKVDNKRKLSLAQPKITTGHQETSTIAITATFPKSLMDCYLDKVSHVLGMISVGSNYYLIYTFDIYLTH